MENKKNNNAFKKFTQKHSEIWKFIKFTIAGGGSSVVELIVHMILLNSVFSSLTNEAITSSALNMIGVTSKGYLYTYLISTTIGYAIAFILNRKITFKADANPTLSMILYVIMVVFTIFANGWIGSAMTTFAQAHNLLGNFWDLLIKIIGMAIPTLWTYPCNRFIIHRKKEGGNRKLKAYIRKSPRRSKTARGFLNLI
ncbi:MAG: GtrA family protein [Clostridiales bacterium]|nr:GtrA family protein [Clostridiales bacterium]